MRKRIKIDPKKPEVVLADSVNLLSDYQIRLKKVATLIHHITKEKGIESERIDFDLFGIPKPSKQSKPSINCGKLITFFNSVYSYGKTPLRVAFPIYSKRKGNRIILCTRPIVYTDEHPKGTYLTIDFLAKHFGINRKVIKAILKTYFNEQLIIPENVFEGILVKTVYDASENSHVITEKAYKDFSKVLEKLFKTLDEIRSA